MISLRAHNVLDYVIGAMLIVCPYVFNFAVINEARTIFLILGFGLIAYSLLTNYYYSLVKVIPVRTHMTLDVLSGVLLMLSPWLFGYRALLTGGDLVVHFVMGLGAVGLVVFTDRRELKRLKVEERTDFRKAA